MEKWNIDATTLENNTGGAIGFIVDKIPVWESYRTVGLDIIDRIAAMKHHEQPEKYRAIAYSLAGALEHHARSKEIVRDFRL